MRHYKNIIILGGLFLCSLLQVQAQQHAIQAQRWAQQNAQSFHRQSQMFQNMNLMKSNTISTVGGKYKFHVVTLAGDTIHAKKNIKIYFDEPIKKLTLKTQSGEETFSPKETREVFITKGKQTIKGIPYTSVDTIKIKNSVKKKEIDKPIKELKIDTQFNEVSFGAKSTLDFLVDRQKQAAKEDASRNTYWIFKIHSAGDLTIYSPFPEYYMTYATLYQLGNDPIKPLTPEVVAELVKGNEKAEKAIAKNNPAKALAIFVKEEAKKEKLD